MAKIPVLVKAEDIPAVTKISFFISGKTLFKNNINDMEKFKIDINSRRVPKFKQVKYFLKILFEIVLNQKIPSGKIIDIAFIDEIQSSE